MAIVYILNYVQLHNHFTPFDGTRITTEATSKAVKATIYKDVSGPKRAD